ncbi:Retrovirus-related Pol polyprotein from transposon TNT 1-94 [Sesamum angolense]|uniref:Retrovirus-related Pol polyprotein from transposon TNT 1-94 n=1 Tax=Sesamum angolense TaxID=2727404 RepID=A0AAE1XA54_9LAMI|nr:Retrovirus-related Pol polyprotein from transposon TNT 1-94 [Sesamum angolense]
MIKKTFVGESTFASGLLNLIHTDVCGPLNTPARGGYAYFITFTNDHSRCGYVYGIRYKSEVFGRFKEYRLEVENKITCKIKALRSNRGGEYLSDEFIIYLKENGIFSQWTPSGMPQLNGLSYSHHVHVTAMVPKVRGLISYCQSRESQSYRPSLRRLPYDDSLLSASLYRTLDALSRGPRLGMFQTIPQRLVSWPPPNAQP